MPEGRDILDRLGSRLRERRRSRGLTQAQLADQVGVSRRFLVQLEAGQGNISVQRLVGVCAGLGVSLEELFRGLGPGQPGVLALVGLRGAGKSTIGQALAGRLELPFVELDQQVEEAAGMSLGEIFELRGEAYFRELEARVLETVLGSAEGLVLATGGSLVTAPETWRLLREGARTAWLKASPRAHLERVRSQGDLRPMRGRPDALRELRAILQERSPLYGLADKVVDTDALGVEGAVEALASW